MVRIHSKFTLTVIGGYNEGKVFQCLQCSQHVPTGFQVPSPPVSTGERPCSVSLGYGTGSSSRDQRCLICTLIVLLEVCLQHVGRRFRHG
jgi:hypothetical protein